MQIVPPFGYSEVLPLQRNQRVRLPPPGEVPDFARRLNAIPLSITEFVPALRHYPIVFSSGDNGKTFTCVAVLGLAAGENLFCKGSGWDERAYFPAYARRFPFCMSTVKLDQVEQQDRLICVEKSHISDDGEPMFDSGGNALAQWTSIEKLLSEFEADLVRTREMCAILADYGLLEPFTMQATLTQGGALHLTGMHRVNEKKLEDLNASQIRNLMRKGLMGRIYLHIVSLENFALLLERRGAGRQAA